MAKKPSLPWHERMFPADFAPKPTVMTGGVARWLQCLEACRDKNTGGFGELWVQQISPWWKASRVRTTTSCSPFTGTLIGMLFDPDADPGADVFAPKYDGGEKTLPISFYEFHNTSAGGKWASAKQWFKQNNWIKKGLASPYGAIGAAALYNLAYEIDPRDMRRTDMVHIDWSWHGGHSSFCWDVHLDDLGRADAFTYVTANGHLAKKKQEKQADGTMKTVKIPASGPGICVSGNLFVKPVGDGYVKERNPLFADYAEYVTQAQWHCVPGHGISAKAVKKAKTWKPSPPRHVADKVAVKITVARFWGMAPPDQNTARGREAWADALYAANFEQALKLARETPPAPFCMGNGRAVTVAVSNVPTVTVPAEKAAHGSELRKLPAKVSRQLFGDVTPVQREVERALGELFRAGWIAKDPGPASDVHDAMSVAAIKDFQAKWGLHPDGAAGPLTRPVLFAAVKDLRAGKTHTPKPPADHGASRKSAKRSAAATTTAPVMLGPAVPSQPHVAHFYWLENYALPGSEVRFVIEGEGLSREERGMVGFVGAWLHFKEKTTGATTELLVSLPYATAGRGEGTVRLPAALRAGTAWTATLEYKLAGELASIASQVELHVVTRMPDERAVADTGACSWDESTWPRKLRAIVAELRATARPAPPYSAQWALSTYGVKEKMNSPGPWDKAKKQRRYPDGGDMVSVRDKAGHEFGKATRYSLYSADIEGTMLLDKRVLNIAQTGRPNRGARPHIYANFDPARSLWHDVTEAKPWGDGSRVPLIPYRVLAINAKHDTHLYYKKVYVKALDGVRLVPTGEVHNGICVVGDCGSMDPGKQFDFFKGREDVAMKIDGGLGKYKNGAGVHLPLSEIVFLDDCAAAKPKPRAKHKGKHK